MILLNDSLLNAKYHILPNDCNNNNNNMLLFNTS